MQEEMMINALRIYADYSDDIRHTIRAGYINSEMNHEKSLLMPCEESESGYICRLVCDTIGNRSVIGKSVFWTAKNMGSDSWVRIYEAKVKTSPLELKNKSAEENICLKRPFHVEGWSGEDCSQRYWELIDGSVPSVSPTQGSGSSMTVFFGRVYFAERVVFIPTPGHRDFEFRFGEDGQHLVVINLNNDCSKGGQAYTCALRKLENVPVDRIIFSTGSLMNIQVYGSPVNYPTLRLRTQKEKDGFRLACSVDSCMEDKDALKGSATQVCQRPPGTLMSCQGLELERLPPAQEPLGRSDEHSVVLVKEGEVTPHWSEILPDLQITDSSQSSPVVKIPKKYQYYGQYKCSCTSTDVLGTRISSGETSFEPTEFDSGKFLLLDIVFQRRYWAAFERRNSTFEGSSVIEVPTQGLPGFFLISATGFSFFETLKVKVSWTEDRKPNAHVTQDAQVSSIHQFPDVDELQNWKMLAYRLSPPITYPDSADGQLVTFDWFLPATQNSLEERHVIDKFWIVDVDKEPLDKLRAWIVSERANHLELYVYYQHSNSRGVFSENSEANIELLEFGCPPEATSRSLASFTVKNVVVVAAAAAVAIAIFVLNVSALRENSVLISMLYRSPIRNASKKAGHIGGRKEDQTSAGSLFELPNHLNCFPSTLKLVPVWLPDDAEPTVFSTSPVYFDFMANTDMPSLDFRLVFTFNDTIREIPISLPNPMKEKSNPVFNTQTSELTWQTVAPQLKPAVEEYKVTVVTTSLVCGTTEMQEIAVRSRDDCPSERCRTTIWTPQQLSKLRNTLSNYTLGVSPQFASFDVHFSSGHMSTVSFTIGESGPSDLKAVYESETPREHIVSLEPFQSVSCDMEVNRSASEPDATFEIKSFGILSNGKSQIPIEGVSFTKVEDTDPRTPGGMYRVENLLPGREYELRGAIKYPSGIEDEMSKEILFITPDEILVDVDEAIKELGEELQLNCKAYVGTQNDTQKEVLWLRSDRSRLPEGASSRTNRTPNADGFCTATLMIPKVETWHAGDYGCFVEPPVEFFLHVPARSVLFTLRVGGLTLDKKQYKAKRGETVEVVCSTTQFGPLTWILADGRHAPVYPSASSAPTAEPVFATPESPPSDRSQALRLWIKEAAESTEGDYVCSMKNESNSAEITQRFKLQLNSSGSLTPKGFGIVKINTTPVTFGEEHVFTCKAESPNGVHSIRWYWYRPEDAVFEAIEGTRNGVSAPADVNISSISTLRIRALPGLQGTLVCALIPPDWEFSEESEIPYYAMSESILARAETEVSYAASIEIRKPYELELGDSIAVDCFGYPSVANEQLQWTFEGINETTTSFVIQPDVSNASSVKDLRVHKQNSTSPKRQSEDGEKSHEEEGSTISLEVSPITANRPEDTEGEIRGSAGEFIKQRTSDSVRINPYIFFSLFLTVALRRSLVQDYFVLV
nr:unnamed protein product [Spirometra erinaceieuropaei]